MVAGAFLPPPPFRAYDSGLPSAPKECLCQVGDRHGNRYLGHPAVGASLEGCTDRDCGSSEETPVAWAGEAGESGKASWRKWPLDSFLKDK